MMANNLVLYQNIIIIPFRLSKLDLIGGLRGPDELVILKESVKSIQLENIVGSDVL